MTNDLLYYKVLYRLVGYNDKDEKVVTVRVEEFHDDKPIEARRKAFEFYDEIKNTWLKNRIISENGIEVIKTKANDLELFGEYHDIFYVKSTLVSYSRIIPDFESVAVLCVVPDDEYNESVICKVSTKPLHADDIVDNLQIELYCYENNGYETGTERQIFTHYGTDYYESGKDERAAHYSILPVPIHWDAIIHQEPEEETTPTELEPSDWHTQLEAGLREGESNTTEFKPAIAYNVKTNRGGITPKYHCAKAICAFLNSNGGNLYIGVDDKGYLNGLELATIE